MKHHIISVICIALAVVAASSKVSGQGCTPGDVTGSPQKNNGGGCAGTNMTERSAGTLAVTEPAFFDAPTPWTDVTAYGARPLPSGDSGQMTTATINGTSSVTVASAGDFIKGDGIVIAKAGASTSQTTPSAPTASEIGAKGSRTIGYKLIGVDALDGLTPPGSAGYATNVSLAFGDTPHTITGISRTSNRVTITISSSNPFPSTSGNQCAVVWNVTGMTTSPNGLQTITFASTTTATFPQSGINESGTVTSSSAVWLSDCQALSAVTRTGTTITATTVASTHNLAAGTPAVPAKVWLYGIQPADLDGAYTIASTTANTIGIQTRFNAPTTEKGSVYNAGTTRAGNYSWNVMGALVYPEIVLTVPTPSGSTVDYLVCANYGSGYAPIGQTLPGDSVFEDYGPFFNSKYVVPPAFGNRNPCLDSVAQVQAYIGTITGIRGTTFTVTPAVTQTGTNLPAFHDNSVAVLAADNAACTAGGEANGGGIINFPLSGSKYWVFNAPFVLTSFSCSALSWRFSNPLVINGTVSTASVKSFHLDAAQGAGGIPTGTVDAYQTISGYGNPMFYGAPNGYGGILGSHIAVAPSGGDQVGIYDNGELAKFTDSLWYTGYNATSRALQVTGQFRTTLRDGGVQGYPPFAHYPDGAGSNPPEGMIEAGPMIGVIRSDTTGLAAGPAELLMEGEWQGFGRGIEFNGIRGYGSQSFGIEIDNFGDQQAPWTPLVWFSGQQRDAEVTLKFDVQDSNCVPEVANFGGSVYSLHLMGGYGCPVIGGDGFTSVQVDADGSLFAQNFLGQNVGVVYPSAFSQSDIGDSSTYQTGYRGTLVAQEPYIVPFHKNFPIAFEQTVTGLSCSAVNGAYSYPSGTWPVVVTVVGWNYPYGGESSVLASPVVYVTVNGSQGIHCSWNPTPGAAGYFVSVNYYHMTSRPILTTSYTVPNYNPTGSDPNVAGSGLPLIDDTQVASLLFRIASQNGPYKSDLTGTFSANRTVALPDETGQIPVTANQYVSTTAPTIASGFGTRPSIVQQNGTAAFEINVGIGGTATTGTVALPMAANGWVCKADDMNTMSVSTRETAFTSTSVTFTASTAWAANDKLLVTCGAF